MESLMKHVENARSYMQDGEYDKAYDKYCVVADVLNAFNLSRVEEDDRYRNEIVLSLEILGRRRELVDQINIKRDGINKLEAAEREYEATEFCGSEHTAAWYSLTGLQRAGYENFRGQLNQLETELRDYESGLLGLWQERIQQVCV